mgnify:CR=1 FL=1
MKLIYNQAPPLCLPPLNVKLRYTEEFSSTFNINGDAINGIVGKAYVECSSFNKTLQICTSWGEDERKCGSNGLSLSTLQGNYCMFRKGDIPIWEEVKE